MGIWTIKELIHLFTLFFTLAFLHVVRQFHLVHIPNMFGYEWNSETLL